MSYEFNEDAELIGREVIDEWHPHLKGVKLAYINKESASETTKPMRGGKTLKLGKAATVPEKYKLLAAKNYEFVIEQTAQYWKKLSYSQQVALIDHELCHCRKDADGFYIADHDVEEFRQILRRRGFWKPDIQAFCEEAQPLFAQPGIQMRLKEDVETGDAVVCGGQLVRIEETGELWTFSVKEGCFIRVDSAKAAAIAESMSEEKPNGTPRVDPLLADASFINQRNARKGKRAGA